MSSLEFSEWLAFSRVEPIGQDREDLRTALLCSVLTNLQIPKGKKKVSVSDFILNYWEEKSEQSEEGMLALAEYAVQAINLAEGD